MENIRVVQYNILCPKLATSKMYPKTDSKFLDPEYRFDSIWNKLSEHMKANAIICLQEVPETWTGRLYDLFASNNYSMFYTLYGNIYNDNMGVCIAYPNDRYKSNNSEIINIGLSLTSKTKEKSKPSFFRNIFIYILFSLISLLCSVSDKFRKWYDEKTFNPLSFSQSKRNRLLCINLTDKKIDKSFTMATYHMPCAFKYEKVMLIHGSQVMKMLNDYLNRNDYNHAVIFAGDFNIRPNTIEYDNLLNGSDNLKLKSSYHIYNNNEPEYTCRTFTSLSNSLFSGCIDYIFYNDEYFYIDHVAKLTNETLLPNEHEPSDHLLLYSEFKHKF